MRDLSGTDLGGQLLQGRDLTLSADDDLAAIAAVHALAEMNDWVDLSRVVQVSGSRMYALKGRLALLEQALMFWAQQRLATEGFTPITVPALVRGQAFLQQGHFPGHEEETYEVPKDELWLAGTAARCRTHHSWKWIARSPPSSSSTTTWVSIGVSVAGSSRTP